MSMAHVLYGVLGFCGGVLGASCQAWWDAAVQSKKQFEAAALFPLSVEGLLYIRRTCIGLWSFKNL